MNNKIKFAFFTLFSIVASFLTSVKLDAFFMNTFFTVSGIMFSIGIGLVVTFNLNGIKNKSYISSVRANLNRVRDSYIIYFSLTTASFIIDNYMRTECVKCVLKISDTLTPTFNAPVFFFLITIYSTAYFIFNFLELQKLNNDIFDKLNA